MKTVLKILAAPVTLLLSLTVRLCALLIGLLKTNPFATLIPLLFPRVGIMFWPMAERKRKAGTAGTEGSDLID